MIDLRAALFGGGQERGFGFQLHFGSGLSVKGDLEHACPWMKSAQVSTIPVYPVNSWA